MDKQKKAAAHIPSARTDAGQPLTFASTVYQNKPAMATTTPYGIRRWRIPSMAGAFFASARGAGGLPLATRVSPETLVCYSIACKTHQQENKTGQGQHYRPVGANQPAMLYALAGQKEKGEPMPYAILRFSKEKGGSSSNIEAHHERKKSEYESNDKIDLSRSHLNYHLVSPARSYHKEIHSRIATAGCRVRKDSVKYVDTIITSGHEFFEGKSSEEVQRFFSHGLEFIKNTFGEKNIFTAVVHMDEETPHMHLCFVPLTKDNRLCAYELLGNRKHFGELQDAYFAHMHKAFPELERGEKASITGRKHIPMQLYKRATRLDAQHQQIRECLAGITPLNSKTKKKEVEQLVARWLPGAVEFQQAILDISRQNDELERELALLEAETSLKDEKYYDKHMQLLVLQNEMRTVQKTNNKNGELLRMVPPEVWDSLRSRNPKIKKLVQAGLELDTQHPGRG